MNFKALKAFSIIVTQGSLAAAAKQLNLSQPSVSRLISLLEQDLDLTLFYRTKRSLTLTPEGEAFHSEINPVLVGLEDIPRIARGLRQVDRQFKIIVTHKIAQGLISPALALLRQEEPELRIAIDVESRIRFETLVGIRRYDLAIASLPVPLLATAIESRPIFAVRTDVLLPQSHPLASKRVLLASDLTDQPLIGLWPDQRWRQQVDELMMAGGVTADFRVETRHVLMSCQLVRDGLGLAFVDRVSVQGIPLDGLVLRPVEPERWNSFGYIFQRDTPLSSTSELFVNCLRRVIDGLCSRSQQDAAAIRLEFA